MTSYREEKSQIRRIAEQKFDAEHVNEGAKFDRHARQRFIESAIELWAADRAQVDPFASVELHESDRSCEIRDERFGGSITVYRPERNLFGSRDDFKLKPGYIGASSWGVGNGSGYTSQLIAEELQIRLRMMAVAIYKLNLYNEVVPGWVGVENPIHEHPELKRRAELVERRERDERATREAKKAERKTKR